MTARTAPAGAPLVSTGDKSHPGCPNTGRPEARQQRWIGPGGELLDGGWLATSKCPNPVLGRAYRLADGRLVPMGCGLVRCDACGKRHALTALEMVRDTSSRMGNPQVAVTLTSVDPDRDTSAVWSKDTEQLLRALRRRWARVEYLAFMEWTTGLGRRSGGLRRPHAHLLLRGVPAADAAQAESVVRRVWCPRLDSHRVEAAPLRAAEDGIAYLALHHLKQHQAPPEHWRGRRLRPSRGWWGTEPAQLRSAARRAVADRAHAHRVRGDRRAEVAELVRQGVPAELADDLVFGPVEDPAPLPGRESAEVVMLRRAPR